MREKASPIAVIAATVLLASVAYARPAKKGAAPRKPTPVVERHHGKPEVHARRVDHQVHERRAPEIAVAAEPEEPAIHVRHNRKIHLKAEPVETGGGTRVATVEDFMTPLPEAPAAAPVAEEHPVKVAVGSAKPALVVRKSKIVVKAPVEELEAGPVFQPVLYTKSGRLIMPAALKGSHEILIHQNVMADRDGLERVRDDEDLEEMRAAKTLVAIPMVQGIVVDERLPTNRRYCRPWTAEFLAALARAHYARFHSSLQVNSAVRTVEFQERLRYTNGNAAPSEGETASPHLTGQAVDLAKHGLSLTEIAWLRGYLLPLVQEGKVDVEEEFQQSCFHISVYRKYMPQAAPRRVIQSRRGSATALAAAIR
jgi:hypothetical protein